MKKTLVFDIEMTGHHLEYLHHLYCAAGQKVNEEFVFAFPESFDDVSSNFEWPYYSNITIHYLKGYDVVKVKCNILKRSYYLSKLLKKTAKDLQITHIFLIVLMQFLPFLPFFLNKKYKVSGIVYQIYLYRWKQSSVFTKLQDVFKYLSLSNFNIFEKVFLLNENSAPHYLNKKYKTNKFYNLVDPVVPIIGNDIRNMREDLEILNKTKVILHLGTMSKTKGTLEIFEALGVMRKEEYTNYTFIFAGKVQDDIKESFYKMYNKFKDKVQIILFDEFCSFEFMGSLLLTCDIILCPYKRTSQSSGIIGYAAQFGKIVIVPKKGMLAKLVRNYKLGLFFENDTPYGIINVIEKTEICSPNNNYLEMNSIKNFTKAILK
jgi:glycosyltransferase involved in cell wall biosynthesis